MLRAGMACVVALLGPVLVCWMARPLASPGCSPAVIVEGDGSRPLEAAPVEAGVDSDASTDGEAGIEDALETDTRIYIIPEFDGADGESPVPL